MNNVLGLLQPYNVLKSAQLDFLKFSLIYEKVEFDFENWVDVKLDFERRMQTSIQREKFWPFELRYLKFRLY